MQETGVDENRPNAAVKVGLCFFFVSWAPPQGAFLFLFLLLSVAGALQFLKDPYRRDRSGKRTAKGSLEELLFWVVLGYSGLFCREMRRIVDVADVGEPI